MVSFMVRRPDNLQQAFCCPIFRLFGLLLFSHSTDLFEVLIADMHNVHERPKAVLENFSELVGKFTGAMNAKKNFSLLAKIRKNFHHLRKIFRELLTYKLLKESSFHLFYLLVSLVCVTNSSHYRLLLPK